jgi:hypothetical protein
MPTGAAAAHSESLFSGIMIRTAGRPWPHSPFSQQARAATVTPPTRPLTTIPVHPGPTHLPSPPWSFTTARQPPRPPPPTAHQPLRPGDPSLSPEPPPPVCSGAPPAAAASLIGHPMSAAYRPGLGRGRRDRLRPSVGPRQVSGWSRSSGPKLAGRRSLFGAAGLSPMVGGSRSRAVPSESLSV